MSLQKYTKEWLEQLCAESRSYAEVLRKAGRSQAGGSQRTLKEKIKEWNIDISHFSGQRWRKTIMFQEKYLPENLFRKDGTNASNQTIRRYLLEYHLLNYVCEGCGCNGKGNQLLYSFIIKTGIIEITNYLIYLFFALIVTQLQTISVERKTKDKKEKSKTACSSVGRAAVL